MSYPVTKWLRYKDRCSYAIPLLDAAGVPWRYEWRKWHGASTAIYWRIVRTDLNMLPVADGRRHPELVKANNDI